MKWECQEPDQGPGVNLGSSRNRTKVRIPGQAFAVGSSPRRLQWGDGEGRFPRRKGSQQRMWEGDKPFKELGCPNVHLKIVSLELKGLEYSHNNSRVHVCSCVVLILYFWPAVLSRTGGLCGENNLHNLKKHSTHTYTGWASVLCTVPSREVLGTLLKGGEDGVLCIHSPRGKAKGSF